MDDAMRVDTLTLAERISLRTNVVDWSMQVPNIGVEFDLRNTNWSRWAVGFNFKYNWNTSHSYVPGTVFNLAEVRAEVRNYWRTLDLTDGLHNRLRGHVKWVDKLVSQRRKGSKHPVTTYYRGFYATYTNYSFLFGHTGYQGSAVQAGMTYGIIRPLYQFRNGNSLDLEFGVSGGVAVTKYDKYRHDEVNNNYPKTGHDNWHLVKYPVLSDARVGFVYRFGKYPVTKKYRRRYDVDARYQWLVDSTDAARRKQAYDQHYKDSVYNLVFNEFEHLYDSICRVQLYTKDSLRYAGRGLSDLEAKNAKLAEDSARTLEQAKNKEQYKADKKKYAEERKVQRAQDKVARKAQKEADDKKKAEEKAIKSEKDAAEKKLKDEKKAARKARSQEAKEAEKARQLQDKEDEELRKQRAKTSDGAKKSSKGVSENMNKKSTDNREGGIA